LGIALWDTLSSVLTGETAEQIESLRIFQDIFHSELTRAEPPFDLVLVISRGRSPLQDSYKFLLKNERTKKYTYLTISPCSHDSVQFFRIMQHECSRMGRRMGDSKTCHVRFMPSMVEIAILALWTTEGDKADIKEMIAISHSCPGHSCVFCNGTRLMSLNTATVTL
jgi:hypothetical protein